MNYQGSIFFVGIGGAGMLPLAVLCKNLGYTVSGSDASSERFELLKQEEIYTYLGHDLSIKNFDIIIYSAAIKMNNPQLKEALELDIPIFKRSEFLGKLTKERPAVLVAGSHGKTTTTGILGCALLGATNSPSSLIGGELVKYNSFYLKGTGKGLVVEADEYDKSFLNMYPQDLIILNIDNDHQDIYPDIDDLYNAFENLVKRLGKDSILIYNGEDQKLISLFDRMPNSFSFGKINSVNYYGTDIVYVRDRLTFKFCSQKNILGKITCLGSGEHNFYNCLAVVTYLYKKGYDIEQINIFLTRYYGVKRRQEIIYENKDVILIDDYAHHPTEINKSLAFCSLFKKKEVIAIFQPHLYSRTKDNALEFAKELEKQADKIILAPIYPAREKPMPGVSSRLIYNYFQDKSKVICLNEKSDLEAVIKNNNVKDSVIISLSAGDINLDFYKLINFFEGNL